MIKVIRDGISSRARRLRQMLRIRYLSWRNPEVCISGVYIPLTGYVSDNIRQAMFDGGYEAAELRTISDNLSPEDRVLEIGTGVGLISTFCAKKIGSERVHTFEANPELAPLIHRVYERNEVSPKLEFCILGDGNGEATFHVHDDFWSSSQRQRSPSTRKIKVERRDINSVSRQIRPTFLVMDIEGGESEIFDLLDLSGILKIAVEIHTSVIGQDRVDEIHSRLSSEGFAIDWQYSSSVKGFKEELFLSRKFN